MATVDADMVTLLQAAPGLSGVNVFQGPVREIGALVTPTAVFVLQTGGIAPTPYLGTQTDVRESGLQIRIRSDVAEGYDAGCTLAQAVLAATQRKTPSGRVTVFVNESEPTYLGQDDYGNFEWSLNARVVWVG